METSTIAQIFGMIFLGIILVCIAWTVMEYIFTSMETPGKRNKKLLNNMKKLKNKHGI